MARCATGCHAMHQFISTEEMNQALYLDDLFEYMHRHILHRFNKIHPAELFDEDRK